MRHCLCLGTDQRSLEARDKKLAALKAALFSDPEALRFDIEELDAKRLSAERLKIALFALPAIAPRRLVIIRQADKLPKDSAELLEGYLSDPAPHAPVLFLEAETWALKSGFAKAVHAACEVVGGAVAEGKNVFDLMRVLGDPAAALKILKSLFDDGNAPEPILGGMVWAWSNEWKKKLPAVRYKKGLLVLQEADFHLKRSKFPVRSQALEVLVVKLSLLTKA